MLLVNGYHAASAIVKSKLPKAFFCNQFLLQILGEWHEDQENPESVSKFSIVSAAVYSDDSQSY
jgi:hypothetical protein